MSDAFAGPALLASEDWCDFCGRHRERACVCWTTRSPWRPGPAERVRVPVLDAAKCVEIEAVQYHALVELMPTRDALGRCLESWTSYHDDRDPDDEDRRDLDGSVCSQAYDAIVEGFTGDEELYGARGWLLEKVRLESGRWDDPLMAGA